MPGPDRQVLTVAQMRAAEVRLIDAGTSIDELMQRAGRGAAEWVFRMAAGRAVTVLCGPGNNGGDGYVIAQVLHERGLPVQVVAPLPPATDAARTAAGLYTGGYADGARGAVLVDCLFGSGLTRPLSGDHLALLQRLAASHPFRIAIDLPSGVSSDDGAVLNEGLPDNQLTLALGAWKWAHWMLPAAAKMGKMRLVDIGVDASAQTEFTTPTVLRRPRLSPPPASANKYSRGMVGIVVGEMPGAAILAARAAMASGAGYVRLLSDGQSFDVPAELVCDRRPLNSSLFDHRFDAILVGPGLGRDDKALARLTAVTETCAHVSVVIDADALHLLRQAGGFHLRTSYGGTRHSRPDCARLEADMVQKPAEAFGPDIDAIERRQVVLTPHQGELDVLDRDFNLPAWHPPFARKVHQAIELDWRHDATIIAKGADNFIFHRDLGARVAPLGSSWLSTAGTGDVLAGIIAARLANGENCLEAACQGVWLHAEAAQLCPPPFTAGELAAAIKRAYAACL